MKSVVNWIDERSWRFFAILAVHMVVLFALAIMIGLL